MELLIVLLGLIADRITKLWALKKLSKINEIVIIKNFFSFSYLENRGAAFGILQNKLIFLSAVTITVVTIMVIYLIKYKPESAFLRVGFSLIISGALGNLIDRVWYRYVVDFIYWHYKDIYSFPTFNVADMMVVIGTFMLALCILKEGKQG